MTIPWKIASRPGERREYEAHVNGIDFYIWHACDAGFGLTAYRKQPDGRNESLLKHHGGGIMWLRTLRRCKERAEHLVEGLQSD